MKHSMNKILFSLMVAVSLPLSSFGQYYLRGDVNRNRTVDISDVTYLIGKVLSSGGAYIPICDVNYDRTTNIADVTELIHYVLSGEWLSPYPSPTSPENAQVFTVNDVSFVMIPVEGGTFDFVPYEPHATSCEVTVGDFLIGQTEVTQALWVAVMDENPSFYTGELLPVNNISYRDCEEFISKLNELTGMDFCFPTDKQWQFAALGGNLSHGYLYSGSDDIDEVAWYNDNNNLYAPYPVGLKLPNELGFYDMCGNVNEFIYSPYVFDLANTAIALGGSTFSDSIYCTVYSFGSEYPTNIAPVYGLRLALPVTSTATAR